MSSVQAFEVKLRGAGAGFGKLTLNRSDAELLYTLLTTKNNTEFNHDPNKINTPFGHPIRLFFIYSIIFRHLEDGIDSALQAPPTLGSNELALPKGFF